jgi:hypothetical protein
MSGTWTACWTVAAEVSGRVRGRTALVLQDRRGGHADRTPTMLTSLGPAMACGSSGPGAVRPRAACVAMSAMVAAGSRHGVRRTEGGDRPPVQGSDRRGHQYGDQVQPVRVCRTPAVRTAVVPQAADGQSAACSLPLAPTRYNFLYASFKAGLAGGRLRRPSSAGSATSPGRRPHPPWRHPGHSLDVPSQGTIPTVIVRAWRLVSVVGTR